MSLTIKLLAVSALLLPFAVAPAQDLKSVLQGTGIPNRIKPTDLADDMRAVKIVHEKQGGGGGDFFSMLMNPMMMMMGSLGQSMGGDGKPADPDQAAAIVFLDKLSISWTNGATVKMFDQDFLVTYAPQINMAAAMKEKSPPDLSKVDLTLTLINTKSIASITPRPDMTKEEWLKNTPPAPSEKSLKDQTLSNIKQIGLGVMMYAADYDDVFPYTQSTKGAFEVVHPYIKNPDITKSWNPGGKFLMNMAIAGVNQTSIEHPAETVLFYEDKVWEDGTRAVVFCDGHAKMLDGFGWETAKLSLLLKLPRVGRPLPATLGANWPPSDR